MEKIKNFFKDKKVGYYLIIADALLALIFLNNIHVYL